MADDDRDLLLAWRDGDRRAGSELISGHFRSLYRFFSSKVAQPDQVEELVQRTFAGAVEGLERFKAEASARTWLFAIARNILRQWYEETARKRGREGEAEGSVADLGLGPSTVMDLRREQKILVAALQRIPLESQVILELTYWEQLKARELSEVFDCPEGTIRSRIRTAKQQLRAELDTLARTPEELESSMQGLETWASRLRDVW